MKRSLTIGCVLLVGGGVTNCGGSAEIGTPGGGEQGQQAGASGSGVAGGFTGTIGVQVDPGGAGGGYVGSVIGDPVGTMPMIGVAGGPGVMGAGAGGWDAVGVGPESAGEGGTAGSPEDPPGVGTAPLGGTGGSNTIPPPP